MPLGVYRLNFMVLVLFLLGWAVLGLPMYFYGRWDWTKRGFDWTNGHAVEWALISAMLGPTGALFSWFHWLSGKPKSPPRLKADDSSWWTKKAKW